MYFNGTTAYAAFTNAVGADTGLPVSRKGSWTLAVWVKGNGTGQNNKYYFTETSSTSVNPVTGFGTRLSTNSLVFVRDSGNNTRVNYGASTNASLDDAWHHMAITYDAATAQFRAYVDGKLDYSTNFAQTTTGSTPPNEVAIGALARTTVVNFFAGAVDDVAVWARALSQGEVQDVMTNSISTPVPTTFVPVVTQNPTGVSNLYPGDNWTLTAAVYGSRPLFYQWRKDGTNYPGATSDTLVLSNVTTNETGQYRLVVTNASGSATSAVAQVTVNGYAAPDITNGIVAYWPLDTTIGSKTPDLVSAYDLTLFGSTAPTIVAGKWGNAMSFTAANLQYASRTHLTGEALPVYKRTNFTVSFWAKAPYNTAGGWAFTESSSVNNGPAFAIGMKDAAASSPYVDTFLRDDNSQPSGLHIYSGPNTVWDDAWHNIVYVQHDAGGTPVAKVYVDGVADQTPAPRYPITPNRTSLGAYVRGSANGFFTGLVDEVVIWERVLSPAEIALLPSIYITNPPSRLTPLAVNSFKPDLPAVAQGSSTVLRWDVPANATQVLISGLGDVTSKTVAGIGSTNLAPTATTTYVLTVNRGAEQVKATNIIGVVNGVVANWNLLDNFDFYNPGSLDANGWWIDVSGGGSVAVVANSCNRMARPASTTSAAYLKLNTLSVNSNQSCTLFFRMIPKTTDAATTRNYVGITDRPCNFEYQFKNGNIGPAVQALVNETVQNPGDYQFAARDIPYSLLTYDTNVLQVDAVYNVWIDVTNVFMGDRSYPGHEDMFSVYIQKEGDPARTCIFTNFTSDRDNGVSDPLTGGYPTDPLTRIYLAGNRSTLCALFDDFYLSKTGYNATIPRAFGYTGPAPALQLQWSGSQWQILFQGTLQASSSVTGTYTNVTGATSPYPLTSAEAIKFYRAVCD
jgi:hypothetical protein